MKKSPFILDGLAILLVLAGAIASFGSLQAGDNLEPDPSFEKTQSVDRVGKVFTEWDGWV